MANGLSPIRIVLTMLLALAVPLCCCGVRAALVGGLACGVVVDSRSGAGEEEHDCCKGREIGHEGGSGKRGDGQGRECSCGKHGVTMLTAEKASVEVPVPVVVGVLEWGVAVDALPGIGPRIAWVEGSGVQRPVASLLGLHCALIV